jgi:hypothetical protein
MRASELVSQSLSAKQFMQRAANTKNSGAKIMSLTIMSLNKVPIQPGTHAVVIGGSIAGL